MTDVPFKPYTTLSEAALHIRDCQERAEALGWKWGDIGEWVFGVWNWVVTVTDDPAQQETAFELSIRNAAPKFADIVLERCCYPL